MKFEKAMRKKAKLRLALTGPSGSGKTYSALTIAKGMGGSVAFIDTEKGSASLYSNEFDFDVLELDPPFTPERFVAAIEAAESAGYDIVIIDSMSHEWNGVGGCLEELDVVAKAKFKSNSHAACSEITPRHRKFLDSILRTKMHVIATMRSKTETAQMEGSRKVQKLGLKSEQRDGVEYEFTTVLDINHETHIAVASKDRTGIFSNSNYTELTPEVGVRLMEWLSEGRSKAEVDLAHFISAAESAKGFESLKSVFAEAYKALRDSPDEQKKATDIYEIRKKELTASGKEG
ncbi:ATP-binding protein [Enterobacter asburiae]|nr:ATP-binding protein [Enterobacter asburiae]